MKRGVLAAVLYLPAVAACGSGVDAMSPAVRLEGATMGTTYAIQVLDLPPPLDAGQLRVRVDAALDAIEAAMSTYDPDSELSRFNASVETAWFPVSPGTATVLAAALEIHGRTGGAFDVTVGPLVEVWGFGPGGFGPGGERRRPAADAIEAALRRVGSERLEVRVAPPAIRKRGPGVSVDLSGIAKGFGVDEIARLLDGAGARRYLVEIGGELRGRGANRAGVPWRVAVERPGAARSGPPCVLPLVDGAVATSGDYRNAFVEGGRRYAHVLDPRTGEPVTTGVVSSTVLAPSAMEADALATALMVLPPDEGLALARREGVAARLLVRVENEVIERRTADFPGGAP